MNPPEFSKYIVYADEAGDHGPTSPEFPVFVLAFCVFRKDVYASNVTTAATQLKFNTFGHDAVVFHEREIRKEIGAFAILRNSMRRQVFMDGLTQLISSAEFTLIASVIDKGALRAKYTKPENPYHLAMTFGVERLGELLTELGDQGEVAVVFESRGTKEDRELELEFRRVCDDNALGRRLPFTPLFAKKAASHTGLEIADLVARPIGICAMRPTQSNRSYEVLRAKFRRDAKGEYEGCGLKHFP